MKKRNFLKSQSAKAYKKRSYKNPYFKKQKKISIWQIILAIFVIAILSSLIIWFFIFSKFAQFKTITVEGLTTIPNSFIEDVVRDQMNEKRFNIFKQNSKYFFNIKSLKTKLLKKYDFEYLEIDANRTNIDIIASEKISEIIWKSADKLVFVDMNGVFIRDLHDYEIAQIYSRLSIPTAYIYTGEEALPLQPTMPIIEDLSQKKIDGLNKILTSVNPNIVNDFDKALRRLDITPTLYQVDSPNSAWLRAKTSNTFDILFDGSREVEQQITVLETVLSENGNSLNEISYIDIRFGNHVYIK